MSVSVTLPQLGESVTEGTVTRWLKQVGDTVQADEPLVEVSTDKVDTEIPAPASGVLLAITAGEDEVVAVGGELGVIGAADEAGAAAPVEAPAAPAPVVEAPAAPVAEPVAAPVAEAPAAPAAAPAAAPSGAGTPVVLPALGESVTEGTVTRWLKAVGDSVAVDEPLVEVSTDKVDTEIPSPVAGTLLEITVGEDAVVQVGGTLGVVGVAGAAPAAAPAPAAPAPVAAPAPSAAVEAPSTPAPAAPVAAPAAPPAPAPAAAPPVAAAPAAAADTYVTPLVRKLASDNGVDLASVTGTGVGGRIRKQDVLAAAEAAKAAAATPAPAAAPATAAAPVVAASPLRGRTEPMTRLRKVIAERMVESLHVSAQLTSVVEVDVTRIAQLRGKVKKQFEATEGVKLSFLPFFAKAAVEALKQYPQVNASIDQAAGTVTYHDGEHLGIAVDTERGLLVPVIRDAGDLNIAGISRKISDLAERTRTNKVSPDELSGGTFTLTNTGSRGALFDTPIINQPQVAILGTGAVVKRPVVVTDETGSDSIAVRSMVYLALTYDHRIVDGADAARFLVAMKQRLEDANFEAELGL
ncbi:2-oxoglutarate dehydrogenase, E2 component, dihydrolipoamide succinyltransferase [Longivirga aurantiaca]|uniref:Dihydrolipoamide acetyltransferase component of pyruvate dehydrogenase complex n=1 Tax=Longivirga aurantiaca TaxID=1837743 RepID=A0ABW1T4Q4_9ACTN